MGIKRVFVAYVGKDILLIGKVGEAIAANI